jgi:hypothetical protein
MVAAPAWPITNLVAVRARLPAATEDIKNNYRKNKLKLYLFIDSQTKVYNTERVGPWWLQVEVGRIYVYYD